MDDIETYKVRHADASKKSKESELAQNSLNDVISRMGNISNDPDEFAKELKEAYKQLEAAQERHSYSLKQLINVFLPQDEIGRQQALNADLYDGFGYRLYCRLQAVIKTAETQQSTAEQLYAKTEMRIKHAQDGQKYTSQQMVDAQKSLNECILKIPASPAEREEFVKTVLEAAYQLECARKEHSDFFWQITESLNQKAAVLKQQRDIQEQLDTAKTYNSRNDGIRSQAIVLKRQAFEPSTTEQIEETLDGFLKTSNEIVAFLSEVKRLQDDGEEVLKRVFKRQQLSDFLRIIDEHTTYTYYIAEPADARYGLDIRATYGTHILANAVGLNLTDLVLSRPIEVHFTKTDCCFILATGKKQYGEEQKILIMPQSTHTFLTENATSLKFLKGVAQPMNGQLGNPIQGAPADFLEKPKLALSDAVAYMKKKGKVCNRIIFLESAKHDDFTEFCSGEHGDVDNSCTLNTPNKDMPCQYRAKHDFRNALGSDTIAILDLPGPYYIFADDRGYPFVLISDPERNPVVVVNTFVTGLAGEYRPMHCKTNTFANNWSRLPNSLAKNNANEWCKLVLDSEFFGDKTRLLILGNNVQELFDKIAPAGSVLNKAVARRPHPASITHGLEATFPARLTAYRIELARGEDPIFAI